MRPWGQKPHTKSDVKLLKQPPVRREGDMAENNRELVLHPVSKVDASIRNLLEDDSGVALSLSPSTGTKRYRHGRPKSPVGDYGSNSPVKDMPGPSASERDSDDEDVDDEDGWG